MIKFYMYNDKLTTTKYTNSLVLHYYTFETNQQIENLIMACCFHVGLIFAQIAFHLF